MLWDALSALGAQLKRDSQNITDGIRLRLAFARWTVLVLVLTTHNMSLPRGVHAQPMANGNEQQPAMPEGAWMYESPFVGFHDQKVRVVESITNNTERAVDNLITGIKRSKGLPNGSSNTTPLASSTAPPTTETQSSSTPQVQPSTTPMVPGTSTSVPVIATSSLLPQSSSQPPTTPVTLSSITPSPASTSPVQVTTSSSVIPSTTTQPSSTPKLPASSTPVPSTTPQGPCATPNGDLYNLPNGTITLSTCGATGLIGPTAAMCRLRYNSTGYNCLLQNYYDVINNGTQVLSVPRTSSYNITIAGARGGGLPSFPNYGGSGVIITVATTLFQGDHLYAVIAQKGGSSPAGSISGAYGGGGGGGSFLFRCASSNKNCSLLVAASGGGGGASTSGSASAGMAGSFMVNGTAGAGGLPGGKNGAPGSPIGQIAQGGDGSASGSGGGGSVGDVTGSYLGGLGFGGDEGGFGAGGGGGGPQPGGSSTSNNGGGGGGYSGGGGGVSGSVGGGGGTFTAANTFIVNPPTLNTGNDGFITISYANG
ncbi:hypothetical protein COCOBI_19-0330 [Coccomyxa sp. Obi]|nr:hypothetical protein COCOBI_19-0330 [Coccomyxa sp. Obi]